MKIERTKNATRNIFFGVVLKVYQIIVPFIMRTAMIYFMGMQYLGLNSLFTSILSVLNLAELGVGSAMVFSMYKPIVDDDSVTICALMKLYRLYYRIIGGVICVVGILLIPFLPYLIHGDVPDGIDVLILYLTNLAATVLSYWLFAYKNSILNAHQRVDVVSKITLITNTILYIVQFTILVFFKNYYFYVLAMLFSQAMNNIITAIVSDRMYPQYKPKGKLDKDSINKINHRIRDLFTSRLGSVIVNSVDTIVISAFLGLTLLAVYQNYYYILTSVIGIISVVFQSCTAGIGNSLITETKEKNFNDLKKLTFLITWISCICSSCFLCLFQPFMTMWVGKEHILSFSAVICFVIYYYIFEINQLLNTYKDAGGIWRQDRFRPLVTAIANLSLNLLFVNYIGIYGIILSTALSMLFVGMPWLLHNLFSTMFTKQQFTVYLILLAKYSAVSSVASSICVVSCHFLCLQGFIALLVYSMIAFIVSNAVYILCFSKTKEYKDSISLIDNMTKGKLQLSKFMIRR